MSDVIEPVETSLTAFIGGAFDGPIDEPVEVWSLMEFERTFGPVVPEHHLGYSVRDYFANGEGPAVIVRVGTTKVVTSDDILGGADGRSDGRGIYALNDFEGVSLIVVPPYSGTGEVGTRDVERRVVDEVVTYARGRRAFVVLDAPSAWTSAEVASSHRVADLPSDPNAAVYFPRLVEVDPLTGKEIQVAPSGAVAGIYTRFDALRGVWKAPAGVEASFIGVQSFTVAISEGDLDLINPIGINALRQFPGRGNVVWGARTLADEHDGDNRYVNARRLLLMIEESIQRAMDWVVFEPNEPATWAEIRRRIEDFLQTLYRGGAFQGRTPNEAFFVRCDATTMTAADIANGLAIALVGVAPLKPAEFVILQIAVHTA